MYMAAPKSDREGLKRGQILSNSGARPPDHKIGSSSGVFLIYSQTKSKHMRNENQERYLDLSFQGTRS